MSVPTAQAYSGVTPTIPPTSLCKLINTPISQWQSHIKNDFEDSIFPLHHIVKEIKQQLIEMGAIYASMSGSGSAVYGIFEGDKLAEEDSIKFDLCDIFVGNL